MQFRQTERLKFWYLSTAYRFKTHVNVSSSLQYAQKILTHRHNGEACHEQKALQLPVR